MKRTLGIVGLMAGLILTLPILGVAGNFGGSSGSMLCGETAVILDTIRTLESGGDYTAQAKGATASGAYQMIDATWRHWSAQVGYDGTWPRAFQAPPAVQDRAAEALLAHIRTVYGTDVSLVPVAWYYPAAITRPALMDIVPFPSAGNTLTPRRYQAKWMRVYESKLGGVSECGPTVIDGEWALPVPRALLEANPAAIRAPHHDYPAWDFPTPVGTEVYAMRAGTIVWVSTWPGNCGGVVAGCPSRCGTGLTVLDHDGYRWIYCHASRLVVPRGAKVMAGELLMYSGNTGNSFGPHLHVGLRRGGDDLCPQPVIGALLLESLILEFTTDCVYRGEVTAPVTRQHWR